VTTATHAHPPGAARDARAAPEKTFGGGLTTQEAAALMTHGNHAPDRRAAKAALIELVAEGKATRQSLGDDALRRAAA
jgi:hypothetical protein